MIASTDKSQQGMRAGRQARRENQAAMTPFQLGHGLFERTGGGGAEASIVGIRIAIFFARLPAGEAVRQDGRTAKNRGVDQPAEGLRGSSGVNVASHGVMHCGGTFLQSVRKMVPAIAAKNIECFCLF